MRVRGVRIGEMFVLEDRGGVWRKVAEARAKCVFGGREDYCKEIDVNPEAFAFGMFGGGSAPAVPAVAAMPAVAAVPAAPAAPAVPAAPRSAEAGGSGLRVEVVDEDHGQLLAEYADVGAAATAALASVEGIRLTPSNKRKKRDYLVMDTYIDMEDRRMCVVVREDRVIGRPDADDEADRGSADGRAKAGA